MKQAVILAGGRGTRLQERLGGLPKPLISVLGIPLLERQILSLKEFGFTDIFILVNHKADVIVKFCHSKNFWGISIKCIDDGKIPKGTAGALLSILEYLDDEFLVVYGDTLFNVDFKRFILFYEESKDIAGALFLHPNDHPADSDLVEVDDKFYITNFHSYPHTKGKYLPNLVNAALYILNKSSISRWQNYNVPIDFAKDLFPKMLKEGFTLKGYISPEYIKDVGTPKRLDKVEIDLSSGKVERASLKHKQKAVFIDRDGTLNIPNGYIIKPEDLMLYDGIGEAILKLNKSEWRTIILTNQPIIARGDCSKEGLNEIHWKLESKIAESGAFIDKIYYCPHHPDSGFENENKEYKIKCSCRKPDVGMLQKAVLEFNIDLLNSWVVGDSTADLGIAYNMGVSSILVETGNAGLDDKYPYTPDFIFPDFPSAVEFITNGYNLIVHSYKSFFEEITKSRHWFVGGLSRSGKSSFSAICKRELKKKGVNCIILSLDRWLLDDNMRGVTVIERYDLTTLEKLYFVINKATHTIDVKLPYYSRKKKFRKEIELTQTIRTNDIIIWEGVVATELAKRLNKNNNTFFIEVDETIRKSRMKREYKLRGLNEEEFINIYDSRELTEHCIIKEYRVYSKYIINWEL